MSTEKYQLTGDYCAYLRKSRADRDAELRGEGDTLARHKKMLEELSEKMCIPIKRFYSEVVSGDTIADRPVMRELLLDVESGIWAGVFVVEVERLARGNTRDQGIVSDYFKYSGTKIVTPAKTYDPNNEFDEEYFEFGLFMARREYKTINRRLQRGRLAAIKEGNFIGSTAPYGYNRIKISTGKGYTLEINEDEAKVVRMVFDWYCNGIPQEDGSFIRLGNDSIARRLDSLGISPRISKNWSKATINDMLQNPTYYGDVRFGYKQYVKQIRDDTIIKTRVVNENCEQNTGKHPAIIDYDLFLKTQEIKAGNRKNTLPSKLELQNPLAGLVYCKKCGALMTRLGPNSRNKYAALKCPNKYCNNVSSPLFLVEEQVLQFLGEWLSSYEVTTQDKDINAPVDKEIKVLENSLKNNTAEISRLETQLNKAYSLLEQEVYTIEIFRERQQLLNREMDEMKVANERYINDIEKLEELKYSNEQFAPRIRFLLDTYSSSTKAVQNELLKEVIERIDYEKAKPNTKGQLHNANFSLNIYPKLPK